MDGGHDSGSASNAFGKWLMEEGIPSNMPRASAGNLQFVLGNSSPHAPATVSAPSSMKKEVLVKEEANN